MTRIQTLQGRRAPLAARVIERIARRRFGRDMDPLGVYAHAPGMLVGYMHVRAGHRRASTGSTSG